MSSRAWKWVIYILPIALFTFVLNAGGVLKRPMGTNDHLAQHLHVTEQAVLAEHWAAAGAAWQQTDVAMRVIARRIEITAERDELQHFYEELARLRGAIQAQERGPALEHVSVLKALFEEFGR